MAIPGKKENCQGQKGGFKNEVYKIILSKRYHPWQFCISYTPPNCEGEEGRCHAETIEFSFFVKSISFSSTTSASRREEMFVRIRKRSLNTWRGETLEVTLVANRRIGQRVQQVCLRYLGSIRLSRIDSEFHRTHFWRKVHKSLTAFSLSPDLRKSIEEKISERVPMPREMHDPGENRNDPATLRDKLLALSQKGKK